MRVIIAGSREITDYDLVKEEIKLSGFDITEVVCGTARGVDMCGESYAKEMNIPIKYFPAEWEQYGKRAGQIRNALMSEHADALILVWDGSSKGSFNMLQNAAKQQLKIYTNV